MGCKAASVATGFVATDGAAGNSTDHILTIDKYAAAIAIAGVVADGAVAFYRNGLTPDVQATAGVVAFIPGDRAVLHVEAAVTDHTHTAAAVRDRLNFVIADRAAVHGEISDIRATVFHPYATAAFCACSYACVVADLAAVHGERAATHQHTPVGVAADLTVVHGECAVAHQHAAIVVANFAAVHGECGVFRHINALSTVKAAIIFFAVGNSALPLPAAVAVAEDKCSFDIDCIVACFSRKRMTVQTEVKGLAFGNYGVGPLI